MQRKVRVWMLWALFCVLGTVASLPAQQALRDTPSHRFIPPGNKPKRDTFQTPEYETAMEELRKLRKSRSSRLPDGETPSLPFDASGIDQLSPETKELIREWSKDSVADISKQIGREIVEFNRQFSQSTGLPQPDDNGKPISFDFSRDVLKQYEEARKTWREQQSSLNSRYNQALNQYRDKWPTEKIPPAEWLEKVQPFINPEFMEQLSKIRDFQDGKTTQLPELPKELLPVRPPISLSKRMIESVVKTLDKGGNDLIQRAKRNNQGKRQAPWWKRFKSEANAQLKSLNKSITDRTEQYASATAASPTAPGRSQARSTTHTTWNGKFMGQLACLAILLTGIGYTLFRWQANRQSDIQALRKLAAPGAIQDGESLLRAIHLVAARQFGRESRFWHHRQLFTRFHETLEDHDPVIYALYERARYSPDGNSLSKDDLDLARHWCEQAHAAGASSS